MAPLMLRIAPPSPTGSGSIFTFTMFAVSFVARLADALVRLRGVLADGVNAAVVKPLCTLVHICTRGKKDTSLLISRVLFWPRSSTYLEFYTWLRQAGWTLATIFRIYWIQVLQCLIPDMIQGGWCRSASPDISEIKVSEMKAQTHFPTHTHTHTFHPTTNMAESGSKWHFHITKTA